MHDIAAIQKITTQVLPGLDALPRRVRRRAAQRLHEMGADDLLPMLGLDRT